MQFKYEAKPTPAARPKAFIDREDDLFIMGPLGVEPAAVAVLSDGMSIPFREDKLSDHILTAKRIFYTGDTLTITF